MGNAVQNVGQLAISSTPATSWGGPCHPKLRLQELVGFETHSTHARRSGAQKGLEYPQWRAKRIIADHGVYYEQFGWTRLRFERLKSGQL